MNRKNRISIYVLHNDYGSYSGEEHMIDEITRHLDRYGYKVNKRRISGIKKRGIAGHIKAGWWSIFGDMTSRKRVELDIAKFNPDVILIQNIFPRIGTLVLRWASRRGIKIVMRLANYRLFCPVGTASRRGQLCRDCALKGVHSAIRFKCGGGYFSSAIYALRHVLSRNTLRRLDGYIAQTEYQRRLIKDTVELDDRVTVIGNIVDHESHRPTAEKWKSTTPFNIAYIGRRSALKGFDTFLSLAERRKQSQFHIMGKAIDKWENRIKKLDNIVDYGFVDKTRISDILAKCHCVVLPSRWPEGMPNVILQANVAGTVVISSSIGGLPEILGYGKFGVVVHPVSSDAFEAAIEFLDQNRGLGSRIAERSYKNAMRNNTPGQYIDRLVGYFDNLL